jgi:hypothetical protein
MVYDGGGVLPDIELPGAHLAPLPRPYQRKFHLFDYATDYYKYL